MLTEGTKAPAFLGQDQDGNPISLADFKGRKLILYFYPQDATPTCTTQACNLRDHHQELAAAGIDVVGVSPDNAQSHLKFISKQGLPFRLIADTDRKIIEQYEVWGEKQMYGKKYMGLLRTTFLIDEQGVISKIFGKPRAKEHAQEILDAVKAMG
ncbi:MAG: thioredoxin-dependent thiol peroxidase [Chitinophagaceae bacterium]|jgi:peroxiredoxin Q/BCP